MSLYKSSDVELLVNKLPEMQDEIENRKLDLYEPYREDRKKITQIIVNYAKENKRKMYGGFALNAIVSDRDKKDAIYKEEELFLHDIDFYSPEPILDWKKICNLIYDAGYKFIYGREAQHKETYSITAGKVVFCDITYVPRNIYNKMPFKEINGHYYIHPNFMTIDYMRMITDPISSYWRIDKAFSRFVTLQKHYPLPHNNNPINISGSTPSLDYALDTVHKFLINRKSTITMGFYAYNYFINESGILNDKSNKKIKLLDVPYFEIMSINYRDDALELKKLLMEKLPSGRIKFEEHYPFFQFTGHSVNIYLEDDLIATIYDYNKRCSPYYDVKAIKFEKGKAISENGLIRIATFPMVLMYALIVIMRARTNDDNDTKTLYHTFISHIIDARSYYLTKNKKTIFDDTPFKDFVINCIGESITPELERKLTIEHRKKKGKKLTFSYDPSTDYQGNPDNNYVFSNTSGNKINVSKNLKLADVKYEEEIEPDDTEEIIATDSEKNPQ